MSKIKNKTSEEYDHFINDVKSNRLPHWESVFHQANIPATLPDVKSVLEFGPGRGLLGTILKYYGIDYKSSDVVDFGATPDYLKSIKDFDAENKFDLVCAFQALEHNPPEEFLPHLKKMAEISKKYVYISLPYNGRWISIPLSINLPKIKRTFNINLIWPRLSYKPRPIEQYRQSDEPFKYHWFEVGEKGFTKSDIKAIAKQAGLKCIKDFHSNSFSYHYFMLFEKL